MNYFPDVNLFNDIREGSVYLDDVYFVPFNDSDDDDDVNVSDDDDDVNVTTTTSTPTEGEGPQDVMVTSMPTATTTTIVGTASPTTSSSLPHVASTPDGASYHQSFEVGTFPFADQVEDDTIILWSTTTTTNNNNNLDDNVPNLTWEVTNEEAASGMYSMKNPTLDNEGRVPSQSNLTLIMPNHHGGGGGALHFSVLAGNEMPFDRFEYYVDGVSRGSINDPRTEFEELELQVGPGSHVFDFVYKFNPQNTRRGISPSGSLPRKEWIGLCDHVYYTQWWW